jgi:cytoplasmic iron level regulating protein YaaA (DUF328/UPF0246 family)
MTDDPLNRIKVKRGSQLPHAKLNEAKVAQIRRLIERRKRLLAEAKKLTNANLAKLYHVSKRAIDRINTGESWSHV